MIFVNTRPAKRACALSQYLSTQGIVVVDLPLLAFKVCNLSAIDKQNLACIDDYKAILFVSETAVRYFFDYIRGNHIYLNHHLPIITVGQTTKKMFTDLFKQHFYQLSNFLPNIISPQDFGLPQNNEGMLQLDIIQNLQKNDKLLIIKGKKGRDVLQNTLRQKGVCVKTVDFYERILPKNSQKLFRQFCQNPLYHTKKVVLITSLTAWEYWQMLVFGANKCLSDFEYVVLGERIYNAVLNTTLSDKYAKITDKKITTKITIINTLHPKNIEQVFYE